MYMEEMIIMKKITSFTIDHLRLIPGLYVSRKDFAGDCPVIREHDSRTVVIMPGVAFDCSRNRIGYGGGYYDRYFAGYDSVYKIAAAYDLQIVEQVPAEPFDLKPDCIVTESHIYAG